ncbi:zinc ribbon domain-containing protein [Streptomyces sp. BE308]|uniref:zinc ribbon domain-containing protein n=1 Tax=Streptomyces sp. BE308 TaxID=3002529 RepID=UPI002E79CC89|nr:zinc ribbon domain-containing protein [Streptomyces sp. BE308]
MAVLQQGILGLRPAKHTPDPRRQAVHCTSCGLSMERDLNAARNIAEHSVAVPVPPVAPGRRRRETPVESPSDSRPLGGGSRGQRNGKTPGHRARCHLGGAIRRHLPIHAKNRQYRSGVSWVVSLGMA